MTPVGGGAVWLSVYIGKLLMARDPHKQKKMIIDENNFIISEI